MGVNLTDVEVVAAAELASWGRRLAALLIDSVVLATIITVTVLAAGVPLDEMNDRIRNGESLLHALALRRAGGDLHTALIGSRNQTFGKMAVGIKVVDEKTAHRSATGGRSPAGSRPRSSGRCSGCPASSITCGRSATAAQADASTTSSRAAVVVRT